LPGDGLATLPYVHLDNLIDAILLALCSETAVGQAYNIIDGQTNWRAHTDYFRRWLGPVRYPPCPRGRATWLPLARAVQRREGRTGAIPTLSNDFWEMPLACWAPHLTKAAALHG
jgi:nucleoside-diphosphate-sugar epimerase